MCLGRGTDSRPREGYPWLGRLRFGVTREHPHGIHTARPRISHMESAMTRNTSTLRRLPLASLILALVAGPGAAAGVATSSILEIRR